VVRCFVAVWPPTDVVSALAALPRPPLDGARWTTQSQWHVTLRFFGELAPPELESAITALAAVAGSLTDQTTADGGPVTRFLGPGLIVWPVEGLRGAAKAVESATAGLGQPVPERRFYGHMTIARGRRGTDLRRDRRLLTPLAISWPVSSLSLVQSQLHPDGARYSDLERFTIGPSTRN
jgi:RNA 2',3'-cyclic 3'-phosphodiesterase